MPNETQLNSNTSLINFTSDYEYVLGATQGRLLEISGMFHSMSFLNEQLQQIRFDLEDTAKLFAEQQGLAPGAIGWATYGKNLDGSPIVRQNTGTLYNGIKAVKSGQTIHLRSEARDKYGHYYGGHVEFGHGNVPARPHLRPALYAVSQASQGLLRSAMYNLLAGAFNGDMRMAFGTGQGLSASYYNKGVGQIGRTFSRNATGQQTKYHFGSIRNNHGLNISRKAQAFRQSFSSTAKKSMGWGKQKSLNPAQRALYRRSHTVAGRKNINQKTRQTRQILSRSKGSKMTSRAVNKNIARRTSMGRNKNTRPKGSSNRGSKLWNQHWRNQAAAKEASKKAAAQRMQDGRNYFNNNVNSVLSKGFGSVAGQSFTNSVNAKGSTKSSGSKSSSWISRMNSKYYGR